MRLTSLFAPFTALGLTACGLLLGIPDAVRDDTIGQDSGGADGSKPDGSPGDGSGGMDGTTESGTDANCGNTQTDAKNCGTCGHDCLGGACTAGQCQPVLVTSNSNVIAPFSMGISGMNLVFGNLRGGTPMSNVARIDKTASMGSSTVITDYSTGYTQVVDGTPWGLAVDSTSYWVAMGSNGATGGMWGGGLDRCSIVGGCPTKMIAVPYDASYAVAVDASNVFFGLRYDSMSTTKYELRKAALDFTAPTTMAVLTDDLNGVAVDGTNVYYTTSFGNTGVYKCAKGAPCSGMGTRITSVAIDAYAMALTSTQVYFVGNTSIERVDIAGGGDVQIASGLMTPLGVSVDANYVYFTDIGDTQQPSTGQVVRCPLAGCGMGMSVLATGDNPRPIVNDGAAVYWGTRTGKIFRLAK